MKKIVRLTESELIRVINRVVVENNKVNENIFSKFFGKEKEDEEFTKEDIERSLLSLANFEMDIYQNYRHRKKYKKLIDDRSTENTIYVDLGKIERGDHFYKYKNDMKAYLDDNGGSVDLKKHTFNIDGNTIIIEYI